ncbi:MAG: SBBP repeat-containing protein [Verrucomicrobiota bacterium]
MVIAGLVTLLFFSLGFSAHAQNGTLAWAKRAGSNGIDDGNGVAVDTNGNVYVTGYFKSTATFGTGETNQTMLTALGQDLFVAKYAPSGGLLWVRQARSQAGWGTSIGVDDAGNSYVFGYFGPTITFATGEPGQVALSAAANDLFLAKYDTDGNFLWAKQAGGSFSEYGYGIAVDGSGDSYVTGRYGSNPVIFRCR